MKNLILSLLLLLSAQGIAQNSAERFAPVQLLLSPNSPSWTYDQNDTAKVEVRVLKYGVPMNHICVNYEQANDMLPCDESGEIILEDGIGIIPMTSTLNPGFRQLKATCIVDGKTYQQEVKLGFSPEKIQTTTSEPADFDSFWKETISKARAKSLNVKLEKLEEYSTDKIHTYLWSISTGVDNHCMKGYLCKPNDKEKHPVLFAPPGAGVKSIAPYLGFAEEGYISLSVEIHGINPLPNKERYAEAQKKLGDYWMTKMDDKNDYYYKSVYVGCVRAIDFLCDLEEFNGTCVATGGSQGGALALVATALNEKVDAVAAFYPALSDMTGFLHGRGGGWPRLFRDGNASKAQITTLSYYDVVNFAKRIKVPGFYSTGFNDNTCCPTSVYAVFNSIRSPKELYITPPCGHWRFEVSNEKSLEFLKTIE